ncbi:chromatin remodelling complex Rsc7/Swp82 subunit-domain-containing protein, partial [Blyttiomyces helicus]
MSEPPSPPPAGRVANLSRARQAGRKQGWFLFWDSGVLKGEDATPRSGRKRRGSPSPGVSELEPDSAPGTPSASSRRGRSNAPSDSSAVRKSARARKSRTVLDFDMDLDMDVDSAETPDTGAPDDGDNNASSSDDDDEDNEEEQIDTAVEKTEDGADAVPDPKPPRRQRKKKSGAEDGEGAPESPKNPDGSVKKKRGRPAKYPRGPDGLPIKPTKEGEGDADPDAGGPLGGEDIETEWDPKGEMKITKDGVLLGGREFRIRTYVLPRHPTRHYMLTVDISKTLQFRDTYIFFLKNPHIARVTGTEEDKQYLREMGVLPAQLRARALSLATARSIFRNFGFKCIKRGRSVRDDYWVGDREEPPPSPAYVEPDEDDDDEDEAVPNAPGGAGSGIGAALGPRDAGGPTGLGANWVLVNTNTIPAAITRDDYMFRAATAAAEFNRRLLVNRQRTFLDVHTNIEQVPGLTQPTHVVVDRLVSAARVPADDMSSSPASPVVDGLAVLGRAAAPDGVWTPLADDPDAEKYPVAIVNGQYQGVFPIFRHRFPETEGAPPRPPPGADQPPAPGAGNTFIPFNVAVSSLPQMPTAYAEAPTIDPEPQGRTKYVECGEITRGGTRCKRPVVRAGESCVYHLKIGDGLQPAAGDPGSPPPTPTICDHCHSSTAPPGSKTPPTLLLTCATCRTQHHPACLDLDGAALVTKMQTYPWHCGSCKICTSCNRAGDDDRLMLCEMCDRGCHTYCAVPPLDQAPEGDWICSECAVCQSCRRRPTATEPDISWKQVVVSPSAADPFAALGVYVCTYCAECHGSFEGGRFCPMC